MLDRPDDQDQDRVGSTARWWQHCGQPDTPEVPDAAVAAVVPYTIAMPQPVLDDLHTRLAGTRWPDEVPGIGWEQGTARHYLRALLDTWAHTFDWRAAEERLNQLHEFRPPGRPPRELAERYYNVARWTEMTRGGHFPALEEPRLLAEDIRAFFRPLRGCAR